jgi:EAL domain-containing protein (putative c-di-GMP-specific phosphodiesterase class I)
MAREGRDALIVGAIVQLGRALGIETIAKGVEEAVVARMLLEIGCTIAQGYLFGRPMRPEQFEGNLRAPDFSAIAPRPELQRARP